jgi:hypothetical protein
MDARVPAQVDLIGGQRDHGEECVGEPGQIRGCKRQHRAVVIWVRVDVDDVAVRRQPLDQRPVATLREVGHRLEHCRVAPKRAFGGETT